MLLIPLVTATSSLTCTIQNHHALEVVGGGLDLMDLEIMNHVATEGCPVVFPVMVDRVVGVGHGTVVAVDEKGLFDTWTRQAALRPLLTSL